MYSSALACQFALLLLLLAAQPPCARAARLGRLLIVGGEQNSANQFNGVCALMRFKSAGNLVISPPYCSGVLVGPSTVLTVGHCLDQLLASTDASAVVSCEPQAGSNTGRSFHTIEGFDSLPDESRETNDGRGSWVISKDIGVVKLSSSPSASVIALPAEGLVTRLIAEGRNCSTCSPKVQGPTPATVQLTGSIIRLPWLVLRPP